MTTTDKKHNHHAAEKVEGDSSLADQVKAYVAEALEKYGDKYEHLHEAVEEASDSLIKTTKNKPLLALGVAVACGVLIGKILK